MSTTTYVRRIKERGGAGGKVAASKPSKTLTPVSGKISGDVLQKSSSGKENLGSISRVQAPSQKPAIRAMPRIERPSSFGSGSDGEAKNRWSTSSVPRGRSSSPFELTRCLNDLRKNQGNKDSSVRKCERRENERSVSRGRKGLSGLDSLQHKGIRDSSVRKIERSENEIIVPRDCKYSVNLGVNSEKKNEKVLNGDLELKLEERGKPLDGELGFKLRQSEKLLNGARVLDICKEEVKFSDMIESSMVTVMGEIVSSKDMGKLDCDFKHRDVVGDSEKSKEKSCHDSMLDGEMKKIENGVDMCSIEMGEKSSNNLKGVEKLKDKGLGEQGVDTRVGIKYPNKLHERLAYLEGKVKRIASDIKRTKEMLDVNNPDSSKVILLDIQDKISGIEKAMGRSVSDSDVDLGSAETNQNDDVKSKMVEKSKNMQADNVKALVKGLNSEELEARLFPHHRLLRNRTSLKASSGSFQRNKPEIGESSSESKPKDKLLSPIDENPIALEFLASLNKEQGIVTSKNEHIGLELCKVQEMDGAATSEVREASSMLKGKCEAEIILTTDETLDEFNDQENRQEMIIDEEIEDTCLNQLSEIGRKTSTGGWFVSEGESVLLAHDDGSCTFYDIANCEGKAEYMPPDGVSPNVWRDCWVIRAPGADGCSGRYVVAASAGNTMDSGFCSWDFYSKDVRAFHMEDGNTSSRTVLAPLPNNSIYRRNALSTVMASENRQWWYKPCGPLIISTASCQHVVKIFDIRDGEDVMKWEVSKPVLSMDYSSPLQWRNRGKVVIAESETVSLWDVSSLSPQPLLSVSSSGRKISALHVNNTDAELGGGVRQRVTSSEAEGNDGLFCTADFINILDFRQPSGVGLKIPKFGVNVQSVFSRGDSIFLGCTSVKSTGKKQCSQVQQFSLRKQKLMSTYALPESNAHPHYTAITQVWGNSNLVMGVSGMGLFVFDATKDDCVQAFSMDCGETQNVRETIGPEDLYCPSFDYLGSRALLISRDRPALWRHLS